ncbi:MAG: tetratricopeptide repeat protein, partial [Gammaproteobacteria bacterium]
AKYLKEAGRLLPGDPRVSLGESSLARIQKQKQQENQVEKLLELAKADVQALRLTSPAGQNALERYRSVLELDPANREAKLGLKKIVDRYVKLAGKAIDRNQFDRAETFLKQAESISPGETVVAEANKRLKETLKQAELAETRKREEEERRKEQQSEQEDLKQREIQKLFDRAERNIGKDNLTAPAGDNALEQYRRILELDPGNKNASRGIQTIGERYLKLAVKAQQIQQFAQAEKYLQKAEQLMSSSTEVQRARRALSAAIDQEKKARDAAEKERAQDRASNVKKVEPPEDRPGVVEKAERPSLKVANLFGSWCGGGFTLQFGNGNWTFLNSSGAGTTFPVKRYKVSGDKIVMYWHDDRAGSMITEFGNFTDDRSKLTQIRGKLDSEGGWHYYNRNFQRCR